MSDKPPQDQNDAGRDVSSDTDLEARREALKVGLTEKRRRRSKLLGDIDNQEPKTGYALAVKISSEFIAGITVGAILGYGVDRYFGTSPWGLIVLLLLGFAAGVLNVLRAVGAVAKPPKL